VRDDRDLDQVALTTRRSFNDVAQRDTVTLQLTEMPQPGFHRVVVARDPQARYAGGVIAAFHGTWVGAGYGKRELDSASVRVLGPDHFVATTRWRDGSASSFFANIEYDCATKATRWIDSWRERGSQRIKVEKTPFFGSQIGGSPFMGTWERPAAPGSPNDRMITAACDYVRRRRTRTDASGF
jgi:hypothetical protein